MFNFEIIILFLLPPTSCRRRRRDHHHHRRRRDHHHHHRRRDYHRRGCRHSFRRRGCTRSRRPCWSHPCCCLHAQNSRCDRLPHCRRNRRVNLLRRKRYDFPRCWRRHPRWGASPVSCSALRHSHHQAEYRPRHHRGGFRLPHPQYLLRHHLGVFRRPRHRVVFRPRHQGD